MSTLDSNARKLHEESVVVDAHSDALGFVINGERRLGERSDKGQFDFPRALEGGVTVEFLAIFYDPKSPGSGNRQMIQYVDAFQQEVAAYPNMALQVSRAADARRAKEEGRVGAVLTMEGVEALEGNLAALRVCHGAGLRVVGITWNRRNEAADGWAETRTGGGLTEFGVSLVKECNRLGIILDLAHLSAAGVRDVLALSEAPVVVTHGNCHALWPKFRNLTDEQLEGVARTGGVVGATAVPAFLGPDEDRAPLSALLDHIDHLVKVMGEDHVGIGMDFDGVHEHRVVDMEDASKLPNLTAGLLERGYSATAIRKILGENFLRVFEQVCG
ncbi:MAG TPA: dipeptidase [Chloroflexota bacterium]